MRAMILCAVIIPLVGCKGEIVWEHQIIGEDGDRYVKQFTSLENCHTSRKSVKSAWNGRYVATKCKPTLHEKYQSLLK